MLDTVLCLGLTPCKRAVFIGSVGALDAAFHIGDLIVPDCSACGDGASRYIAADRLDGGDVFGERVDPDAALTDRLRAETDAACAAHGVRWHRGPRLLDRLRLCPIRPS